MDKSKIAVETFDHNAREYQDKFMDLSQYHDSFDQFCLAIERENADILDMACGPGNITRYLLEKRLGFKILGVDLSSKMIELAERNNPTAEFRVMDCRDIDALGQAFDGVICGFGLPYLSKEEALELIRAVALLNPNGVFYLSTMEGDYAQSGWEGPSSGGGRKMYIHYHQADYLTSALAASGLEITGLSRVAHSGQNGQPMKDLLITAINTPTTEHRR